MIKTCPINWKNEDGPYPCPFKHMGKECSYNPLGINLTYFQKSCTPQHVYRFTHDSKETTIPCEKCGKQCKTTVGEIEGFEGVGKVEWLCYDCADEKFGWSLAAHIRGDC